MKPQTSAFDDAKTLESATAPTPAATQPLPAPEAGTLVHGDIPPRDKDFQDALATPDLPVVAAPQGENVGIPILEMFPTLSRAGEPQSITNAQLVKADLSGLPFDSVLEIKMPYDYSIIYRSDRGLSACCFFNWQCKVRPLVTARTICEATIRAAGREIHPITFVENTGNYMSADFLVPIGTSSAELLSLLKVVPTRLIESARKKLHHMRTKLHIKGPPVR